MAAAAYIILNKDKDNKSNYRSHSNQYYMKVCQHCDKDMYVSDINREYCDKCQKYIFFQNCKLALEVTLIIPVLPIIIPIMSCNKIFKYVKRRRSNDINYNNS